MAMDNSFGQEGMDSCLWRLPLELTYSVVSFLEGKELSSLVEAMHSSKEHRALLRSLASYVMKRMQDEAVEILSNRLATPQPALVAFVNGTLRPKSQELLQNQQNNVASFVRNFSEWCLLMDYVLKGTRHGRLTWPVGVGVFATSPISGGTIPLRTKVVLSVPVWDPNLVTLCHDVWLPSNPQKVVGAPTHFSWLPSEGDIDGFVPDHNIGVLSCFDDNNRRTFRAIKALARDDDFLQATGRPDCCLSILPSFDCPIFGFLLRSMIQSSSRHVWMLREEIRANNMLCFFDTHPKYVEQINAQNHPLFIDRVVDLMKAIH